MNYPHPAAIQAGVEPATIIPYLCVSISLFALGVTASCGRVMPFGWGRFPNYAYWYQRANQSKPIRPLCGSTAMSPPLYRARPWIDQIEAGS